MDRGRIKFGDAEMPTQGPQAPYSNYITNLGYPPVPPPILPPIEPPPIQPPSPPAVMKQTPPPAAPHQDGPIDDCMRSVTVSGVQFSFVVDVYVDGKWRGTAIAPPAPPPPNLAMAPLGGGRNDSTGPPLASVEVLLTGCCLKLGQLVQAAQTNPTTGLTSTLSGGVRVESHTKYDWLTQNRDMGRTGWNDHESILKPTPSTFAKFGPKFSLPIDAKSYTQPLYLHHQYIPGLGARNMIFVATENDSLYAFDADNHDSKGNGQMIWHRSLLPTGHRPVDGNLDMQIIDENGELKGCVDILPIVGVSSTPVIDCGCKSDCACGGSSHGCGCAAACRTPTIYVVAKSIHKVSKEFKIQLHSIDAITGLERNNSPVDISGQYDGIGGEPAGDAANRTSDGAGHVLFNPKVQNNRPGLLLLNGKVYIGFAGHCDHFAYLGWVFAYDAETLQKTATFCTTPDGDPQVDKDNYPKGGIWQSGMGLASDGSFIYCTTGNGFFDENSIAPRNFGNAIIKLSQELELRSFFVENDFVKLNGNDLDFGAGGVLIVPDPQSGPSANLLVSCGKTGDTFVLDRNNLGGFSGLDPAGAPSKFNNPEIISTINLQPGATRGVDTPFNGDKAPGCWGGPAFFNSKEGQRVYYCSNGDADTTKVPVGPLISFALKDGFLSPIGFSTDGFRPMGSMPVVSSAGQDDGVVWAVNRYGYSPNMIYLRAYAASAVGVAFHTGDGWPIGPWGPGRSFVSPTVVNGKVYVPCGDRVAVFY
jgi:hypothetical protein